MAKSNTLAEDKRTYMLTQPLYKLIPAMAIPTIASMMINSIYNLADTYFVSTLGTYATGAVGINASIDNIIMMAGSVLATGAASCISRMLGARRVEEANCMASTAFFTAAAIGILIMIFGLMFAEPLVRLLGATDLIIGYTLDYAGYVFYAAPFMATTFVLVQSLRAEGNAKLSMIGMMVGAVLNIILDPIFIMVFQWGVKGASAATALSKLVSFVVLILPYLRRRAVLHLSIKKVSYSRNVMPQILKMGSPSLFRTGLSTLAAIVLNNIAAGYSESALAAISVCNRIMMLPFAICLGFGQGYQPVSGFCFGARRYDRARASFRFASWISVIGLTVISAAMFIFSPQIIKLFTETDAEMLSLGTFCLRMNCAVMPIHAWCVVVNMLSISQGKAVSATLLAMSRQGIFFFPALPILIHFWGVWGVAAVQAVADALSVIMAAIVAVRSIRNIKRLEAQAAAAEAEAKTE